jgi:hypothetical protein
MSALASSKSVAVDVVLDAAITRASKKTSKPRPTRSGATQAFLSSSICPVRRKCGGLAGGLLCNNCQSKGRPSGSSKSSRVLRLLPLLVALLLFFSARGLFSAFFNWRGDAV